MIVEGTESSYRKIPLDSSSSLKDFANDRKMYYRKYILGEKIKEKDTQASIMGRVVETLLLEPELFDERFRMSACIYPPTGLMLEFVTFLCEEMESSINEDGEITVSFEDASRTAYDRSGFKIKYEQVINKFSGSDAQIYYEELLASRAGNITIVTTANVENAEKIVSTLKTNPITAEIVNLVNSDEWEVVNQLQVEGFDIDGHKMKGMMDKIVTSHKYKTVQVYDLKCIWAVEDFFEEYYLHRKAYIQAYVYYKAAQHIVNDSSHPWYGYKAEIPKFIACDSVDYYSPLIYTLDEQDMIDAYEGFEYKGKSFAGVKSLIEDLDWALEMNTWNISKKNYDTNGLVKLRNN